MPDEMIPASRNQAAIWLLEQAQEAPCGNNVAWGAILEEEVSADDLAGALQRLSTRHPLLRACFLVQDGKLFMRIPASLRVRVDQADLSGHISPAKALERRSQADAQKRFDLGVPGLFRASLFRLGPQRFAFLLTVHHSIMDGWSMGILLAQLMAYLRDDKAPGKLPERRLFLECCAEEVSLLGSRDLGRQLSNWKERLKAFPGKRGYAGLKTTARRKNFRGKLLTGGILAEDVAAVKALAAENNFSEFNVYLTVHLVLVHLLEGTDRPSMAFPVSNRPPTGEAKEELGLFLNTLPMTVEVKPGDSLLSLSKRVWICYQEVLKDKDLPLPRISQAYRELGTGAPGRELFGSILNFQNYPNAGKPAVRAQPVERYNGFSSVDLSFEIRAFGPGLALFLSYDEGMFSGVEAEKIHAKFLSLAGRFAREPDTELRDLEHGL